ncbi:hypothetical protein [Pseudomonas sp. RT6P73]
MAESLVPLAFVDGQLITFCIDLAEPGGPKVVIPGREHFQVNEEIKVLIGDIVVAFHTYRQNDSFPIHIFLDKQKMAQVTGTKEGHYEIKHLDGKTSISRSFYAKVELYNSQSTVSHTNEVEV